MAIIENTIDVLLDTDSELQELNGDFLTGDCSNNYLYYITASHTGAYKQFPLVGIGIDSYLNAGANTEVLEADIIAQLTNDIFTNPSVDLAKWPSSIKINNIIIEVSE